MEKQGEALRSGTLFLGCIYTPLPAQAWASSHLARRAMMLARRLGGTPPPSSPSYSPATTSTTSSTTMSRRSVGRKGYAGGVRRGIAALRARAAYHAYTLLLFTVADLKTIFLPITAFACATAPLHAPRRLLAAWAWTALHQLMCNVSNQARGAAEDAVNKPWRPLPAGRVTPAQVARLRWATVAACLVVSAAIGADVLAASVLLVVTTVVYDEGGLAGHWVGKNVCNIGGYVAFEVGATKLMGASRALDTTACTAVALSGALIFTTIQAQDFADVEGDAALGRVTFPLYAPAFSRQWTLVAMLAWSAGLAWFWGTGPVVSAAFVALGAVVGTRFYVWRDTESDKTSYVVYNMWLMIAHVLAAHARTGCLGF